MTLPPRARMTLGALSMVLLFGLLGRIRPYEYRARAGSRSARCARRAGCDHSGDPVRGPASVCFGAVSLPGGMTSLAGGVTAGWSGAAGRRTTARTPGAALSRYAE